MMAHLGLEMKGRLHSGLDDARNIAQIVIRLLTDEFKLRSNDRLPVKFRGAMANARSDSQQCNSQDPDAPSSEQQTI